MCWLGVPDRLETQPAGAFWFGAERRRTVGRGLTKLLQLLRLLLAKVSAAVIRRTRSMWCSPPAATSPPPRSWRRAAWHSVVLHELRTRRVTRLLAACSAVAMASPLPPAHRQPASATARSSLALQPLGRVPAGQGPLLVVMEAARRCRPTAWRAAVPACWRRLPRGAPQGDNDPDTRLLLHPQLVERRFSDEIPGCCNTPIWPSAGQKAA